MYVLSRKIYIFHINKDTSAEIKYIFNGKSGSSVTWFGFCLNLENYNMKKLILFIPFLVIACKKDNTATLSNKKADSTILAPKTVPEKTPVNKDSLIANSTEVKKVLDEGVNREVNKNEIVRTADASMLPFTIGDQFTNDTQKFILKIKNVSKAKLKISVESRNPMNIRIEQIKRPDGSFDGPWGRTLNLETPQKGEYWIMLGKNLMADGTGKGHFSLKVE